MILSHRCLRQKETGEVEPLSKRNDGKNRQGDAMVVVLCIMALLLVLSLSMLLAASATIGTSKKHAIYERCRIMAETYSGMADANILGKEKTGAAPEWQVVENCNPQDQIEGGSESLSHMAMRSVRAYMESGLHAPIPVFDNEYVGLSTEDGLTSEEAEAVRKTEEKSAAVFELQQYSQQGYQMEMKVYLDLNQNLVNEAENKLKNQEKYKNAPSYLTKTLACQNLVRLITVVSCKKDREYYQIRTYYTAKVYPKSDEAALDIYWKWEKERME